MNKFFKLYLHQDESEYRLYCVQQKITKKIILFGRRNDRKKLNFFCGINHLRKRKRK